MVYGSNTLCRKFLMERILLNCFNGFWIRKIREGEKPLNINILTPGLIQNSSRIIKKQLIDSAGNEI